MNTQQLADIRREYSSRSLDEADVDRDPFAQFGRWMEDALSAELPEPTAMTLATVDGEGRPSSRVVLLKGFDPAGFVFYTNYLSRKGQDIENSPYVALSFFWPELERQVLISGRAGKVMPDESDEYFASRPFESRIGAWASAQSTVIGDRAELEAKVSDLRARYADGNVPRPPHWGGYRVVPGRFEFWQGRPSRLHDRICYTLREDGWAIVRLSP